MSSEIAIKVENLSKCYQIYAQPHDRLKQSFYPRLQRLVGKQPKQYFREFWALKDVSFEVKKGETVGIIGRNGSGKSTLLQMICGTLNPTSGSITTHGRVAALLELGSGFNPEFTGRENVYMNAAVLGLSREETEARFADIEAFADIGQFIDQAVKTYSSGMTVRLAFAVIAHVDADILVVDEALSVGDGVFTQKCMRFIRAFQANGTLLFVSHDMSSVQNLCRTSIWLGHGEVRQIGTSKAVAESYLRYTLQEIYGAAAQLAPSDADSVKTNQVEKSKPQISAAVIDYMAHIDVHDNLADAGGWKTGVAEVVSVKLERVDGESTSIFEGGEKVRMTIRAVAHQNMDKPILGFLLKDRLGQDLFGENTLPLTVRAPRSVVAGQSFEATYVFNLPMLPNGTYAVMASVANGDLHTNVQHHYMHDALILNVASSKVRWGLVGIHFENITLEALNG
jgi:lipopolysaccharide transport system ATP-binding protein